MFGKGYNSEATIKGIAKVIFVIAPVLCIFCIIAAVIVLATGFSNLWWLSIVLFFGGLALMAILMASAHLVWGFGDIVGNVMRMSRGSIAASEDTAQDSLPDL